MKGQVTLEYMTVSLVALVLLSLAVGSLYKIKEMSDSSYELMGFKASAEKIHSTSKELCAMGDGNSREIDVKVPVEVEEYEDIIRYSNMDNSIIKESHCRMSMGVVEGRITLKNKKGTIVAEN